MFLFVSDYTRMYTVFSNGRLGIIFENARTTELRRTMYLNRSSCTISVYFVVIFPTEKRSFYRTARRRRRTISTRNVRGRRK